MALTATIYKANLQVVDLDRDHYQTYSLTLAKHPSETDERMMLRLLAFAMLADEGLAFTRGLSTDDEPDLWQMDLTGDIQLWVELGTPDEKRIRRACGRSKRVVIFAYGGSRVDIWWQAIQSKLSRFNHLTVMQIPKTSTDSLSQLIGHTQDLQVTIQEGTVWVRTQDDQVEIEPEMLKSGQR